MGMGFQLEQHRLGLWVLSWDLKKTISLEMGLGPPFTTLIILSKILALSNSLALLLAVIGRQHGNTN